MRSRAGSLIRPLSADIGAQRAREIHDVAQRRVAWVLAEMPRLRWSLEAALVQAYTQGLCDMCDAAAKESDDACPATEGGTENGVQATPEG